MRNHERSIRELRLVSSTSAVEERKRTLEEVAVVSDFSRLRTKLESLKIPNKNAGNATSRAVLLGSAGDNARPKLKRSTCYGDTR